MFCEACAALIASLSTFKRSFLYSRSSSDVALVFEICLYIEFNSDNKLSRSSLPVDSLSSDIGTNLISSILLESIVPIAIPESERPRSSFFVVFFFLNSIKIGIALFIPNSLTP